MTFSGENVEAWLPLETEQGPELRCPVDHGHAAAL